MKGWLPMTLGLLAVVLGAVWTLQGFDVLEGSAMSGQSVWTIVGPIVLVVGLTLIVVGVRARGRARAKTGPQQR